jgi:hypothetical protein
MNCHVGGPALRWRSSLFPYCRLHVVSNNTKLNEQARAVVSHLQQVEAQSQLFLESLQFDKDQAKNIGFCKSCSL